MAFRGCELQGTGFCRSYGIYAIEVCQPPSLTIEHSIETCIK